MKLQIIIAADSYISHNPKKKLHFALVYSAASVSCACRNAPVRAPQPAGPTIHALAAEAMDGCGYMHAWPAWLLHDAFTETE